jgi:uncharacterized membrane protein
MVSLDPVPVLIVSLALAMLWFFAGLQKLRAFEVFVATLGDYRLLPRHRVRSAAVLVSVFELVLGAGLIVPLLRKPALIASAALLLLYAAAMAINLLRGRHHIDCGCMGPMARQSLNGWLVARNLVLALAALSAISAQPRALVWIDAMTVAAGIAALAFQYATVNLLIANAPNLARLRQ